MALFAVFLVVLSLVSCGAGTVRLHDRADGNTVYLVRSPRSAGSEKLTRVKRSMPDSKAIFFMRNQLEGGEPSMMNKRSAEPVKIAEDGDSTAINLTERGIRQSKIRQHRKGPGGGSLFYLRSLPNGKIKIEKALNIDKRSPRKSPKSIFYFRRGSQVGYLEGEGVQGGPMGGMGGRKKHGKVSLELEGITEEPPLLMFGSTEHTGSGGEEEVTKAAPTQITGDEEEEGNLAESNQDSGESEKSANIGESEKDQEEEQEDGEEEEEEEGELQEGEKEGEDEDEEDGEEEEEEGDEEEGELLEGEEEGENEDEEDGEEEEEEGELQEGEKEGENEDEEDDEEEEDEEGELQEGEKEGEDEDEEDDEDKEEEGELQDQEGEDDKGEEEEEKKEKEEEEEEEELQEEVENTDQETPSTGTYLYTTTPTYFFTTGSKPQDDEGDHQELWNLLELFSSLQGWTVSTINEAIRIFYYLIEANSSPGAVTVCQDDAVNCEVDMCTVAAVANMCKKTCGFCYTPPPPATVEITAEVDDSCIDFDPDFCSSYGNGHCWNADVENMCRKSCSAC